MKTLKHILLLFSLLTCTAVFSQVPDKENKTIRIPAEPSETKKDTLPTKIKVAPKLDKKEDKSSGEDEKKFIVKKSDKPFSMTEEDGLKSSGEIFEKRWSKDLEKGGVIRTMSDQFLGEHKIDAEFVNIICRDHGREDGDLVRIYLNEEIVFQTVRLTNTFRRIKIDLKEGKNVIDIEALNEGSLATNTGQFLIYDDFENLISSKEWRLLKGVKARIVFYNQKIQIKEKISETTTDKSTEASNN